MGTIDGNSIETIDVKSHSGMSFVFFDSLWNAGSFTNSTGEQQKSQIFELKSISSFNGTTLEVKLFLFLVETL